MNRWKSVGIVVTAAGVLGLGFALRPGSDDPQPIRPVVTQTPVASAAPLEIARTESPILRPAAPAQPSPLKPSPKPVPSVEAKPAATSSPIASPAPAAEIPQSSPIASTAPPPVAATTEPAPSTVAATAQTQQAPAAAKRGPVTLTLKKDSVIGIRLDDAITSETARVDQKITAKVSRDVIVDGTTAIPAGAKLEGTVVRVERATAANPRGKIGIRFTALIRPDNTRMAIATDTILREAPDPSNTGAGLDSNAFSAVVGTGASRTPPVQAWRSGSPSPSPATPRPRDVRLLGGALLTVHLTSPLSITIDRNPE